MISKWWREYRMNGLFSELVNGYMVESVMYVNDAHRTTSAAAMLLPLVGAMMESSQTKLQRKFWRRLLWMCWRQHPDERLAGERGPLSMALQGEDLVHVWFIALRPKDMFHKIGRSEAELIKLSVDLVTRMSNLLGILRIGSFSFLMGLVGRGVSCRLPADMTRGVLPLVNDLMRRLKAWSDSPGAGWSVAVDERRIVGVTLRKLYAINRDDDLPIGKTFSLQNWLPGLDGVEDRAWARLSVRMADSAHLRMIMQKRKQFKAELRDPIGLDIRPRQMEEVVAVWREGVRESPFARTSGRIPNALELAVMRLCVPGEELNTALRHIPLLATGPSQWHHLSREEFFRGLKGMLVSQEPGVVCSGLGTLVANMQMMACGGSGLSSVFKDSVTWPRLRLLFMDEALRISAHDMGPEEGRLTRSNVGLDLERFRAFVKAVMEELIWHEQAETDRLEDLCGGVEDVKEDGSRADIFDGAKRLRSHWEQLHLDGLDRLIGKKPSDMEPTGTEEGRQAWRNQVVARLLGCWRFIETFMCGLYLRRQHERALEVMPAGRHEAAQVALHAYYEALAHKGVLSESEDDEASWLLVGGGDGRDVVFGEYARLLELGLGVVETRGIPRPGEDRPDIWKMSAAAVLRFVCNPGQEALHAAVEEFPPSWRMAASCELMNLWADFLGQFIRIVAYQTVSSAINAKDALEEYGQETVDMIGRNLQSLPHYTAEALFADYLTGTKNLYGGTLGPGSGDDPNMPCAWTTAAWDRSELVRRARNTIMLAVFGKMSTGKKTRRTTKKKTTGEGGVEGEEGAEGGGEGVVDKDDKEGVVRLFQALQDALSESSLAFGATGLAIHTMLRRSWYGVVFRDSVVLTDVYLPYGPLIVASATQLRVLVDAMHEVFGSAVYAKSVTRRLLEEGVENVMRFAGKPEGGESFDLF